VFDTNVLFSAVGWRGKPYPCVELARQGAVDGITCWEVLDELSARLQSKLAFSLDQAYDVILDYLSVFRLVPITGQLKVVADDPDDDKILDCAIEAGATHIVTGDRRHLLPLGNYQGIQIVSPAELIALLAPP
jgi:putative PIN family toxin of toxin-antitoxin system